MEEVLNNGGNLVNDASGSAREFAAQLNFQPPMEALIAAIVIGLLICFFGLKLVKVLNALMGLLIGALAGVGVAHMLRMSGITFAIVVFACAAVLAALSFFLYKFGVFCLVFCVSLGFGVQIADPENYLALAVLAIALVIAIVAVVFVEPVIIICTALSGGATAGTAAASVIGLENIWIGYAIGAVLAILGMVVQFMLHSRKVGKKEKVYAEKVKEMDSVESEVEKARSVLDDTDEEEEEEDLG